MDDPNQRVVVIRTDESAENFWSRVRSSEQISPNFNVIKRDTPYGRQQRPFTTNSQRMPNTPPNGRMPLAPIKLDSNSRKIEMKLLQNEIKRIEVQKTPVPADFVQNLVKHNMELEKKLQYTEKQLKVALDINKSLAAQVSDVYKKM